jgi:hypothetical protein
MTEIFMILKIILKELKSISKIIIEKSKKAMLKINVINKRKT